MPPPTESEAPRGRSARSILGWAALAAAGLALAWWWRLKQTGVTEAELSFLQRDSWLAVWIDAWLARAPSLPVARAPFALLAWCGLPLIALAVLRASNAWRAALALVAVAVAPLWMITCGTIGAGSVVVALSSLVLVGVSVMGGGERSTVWLSTLAAVLCVAGCARIQAPLSTRVVLGSMAVLVAWWSRRVAADPRAARLLRTSALACGLAAVVFGSWPRWPASGDGLIVLAVLLPPALAVAVPGRRLAMIVGAALCIHGAAVLVPAWRHAAASVPFRPALEAMARQRPDARELMAGAGVPRGVARLATRDTTWRVVDSPAAAWVGELAVAGRRPTPTERSRLEQALGERTLQTYGIAHGAAVNVRWALHRPFAITRPSADAMPDIAIVSIDTLRADHLPLYGYSRDTAPFLSAWARQAVVYEQARALASETVPSFASLLTGRFPAGHGIRGNTDFLLPGNWTLARVLTQLGYDTAAFVSSSVLAANKRGLDDGFAHYDDTLDRDEPQRPGNPSRLSPSLVETIGDWLDQHENGPKPWLMWVHCIDPHGPYNPLPAYEGRFRSEHTQLLDRESIPNYQWKGTLDFFRYADAYDDEILQFDTEMAPLLRRLSQAPGPRGRIVIFTADHGEQFGEHGSYFVHGHTLHREETHVPLIWLEVGKTVPRREPVPVSSADVVPTLLERLGVSTDLPLDGMTLSERVARRAPVFTGYQPGETAVLHDGVALLRDTRQSPAWQVAYSLAEDPREARPMEPSAALVALLDEFVRRDPIAPAHVAEFERQQWATQSPEDLETLRSLGYVGPAPQDQH